MMTMLMKTNRDRFVFVDYPTSRSPTREQKKKKNVIMSNNGIADVSQLSLSVI
jgi:hypothetical protein